MPNGDQVKTAGNWVLGVVAACAVVAFGNWLSSFASSDAAVNNRLDKISSKISVMQVSQAGIQRDVTWIKGGINTAYSEKEAQRAHKRILRTDQDQYRRLDNLRSQVNSIGTRVDRLEHQR